MLSFLHRNQRLSSSRNQRLSSSRSDIRRLGGKAYTQLSKIIAKVPSPAHRDSFPGLSFFGGIIYMHFRCLTGP